MKKIAVVGGGISAVSFIVSLLENTQHPFELIIVAPKGLGYAPNFDTQPASSLCNTSVAVNSVLYKDPQHFKRWLETNGHSANDDECVPRSLYGKYLRSVSTELLNTLSDFGIHYSILEKKFAKLRQTENQSHIYFDDGSQITADYVVFCLGHTNREKKEDNYLYFPENQTDIQNIEDIDEEVLVLGSRLSAIDTALLLKDKNNISLKFVSVSGQFPAVRQSLLSIEPKALTKENIERNALDKSISIYDSLLEKIVKEVQFYDDSDLTLIDSDPCAQFIIDAKNAASIDKIMWQFTLDNIMFAINSVWNQLSNEEQRKFIKQHEKLMKRYLYAMPYKTGDFIRRQIEIGRISLASETVCETVRCENGRFDVFAVNSAGVKYKIGNYRYIIDASGCTKQSLFVQDDGTISLDRNNFPLSFDSGSFTPNNEMNRYVYALGSMSTSLPIVNYIKMISYHAELVSMQVIWELTSEGREYNQSDVLVAEKGEFV